MQWETVTADMLSVWVDATCHQCHCVPQFEYRWKWLINTLKILNAINTKGWLYTVAWANSANGIMDERWTHGKFSPSVFPYPEKQKRRKQSILTEDSWLTENFSVPMLVSLKIRKDLQWEPAGPSHHGGSLLCLTLSKPQALFKHMNSLSLFFAVSPTHSKIINLENYEKTKIRKGKLTTFSTGWCTCK